MKIIDHTPLQSKNGNISPLNKFRALIQYGQIWLLEHNAQKIVIACFEKVMDNHFTLLRNIKLTGADITIPLILIGPTGLYVMYATPLRGMYRAKGDSWGTMEGYIFKPARVNLITRTARLGRAVQTYLERHGYPATLQIETVLLATDPLLHIDSVRPLVRVVMRDALEHFAVTVIQGRGEFSADTIHDIRNRLVTSAEEETPEGMTEQQPSENPVVKKIQTSPFSEEGNNLGSVPAQVSATGQVRVFEGAPAPAGDSIKVDSFGLDSVRELFPEPSLAIPGAPLPDSEDLAEPRISFPSEPGTHQKKLPFSAKQIAFLIAIVVIEIIIVVVFLFLFASNS